MEDPIDGMAISSDDALRSWEEEVEDAVANAMDRGPEEPPRAAEPVDQGPATPGQDQQPAEEQVESTEKRSPGMESYVGELLVAPEASPADTFKFCLDLKTNHNSEIISIDHSERGTTIRCTVPNPASLLTSIHLFSGISSWAVVAQ